MTSTKITYVSLHNAEVASAVTAKKMSQDNIGIVVALEPSVYRGLIRGLQGGSIHVIWSSSSYK